MKKVTDFLNAKKGIIKHLPIRGAMKVKTRARSEQIQKYLFDYGYSWDGSTKIEDFWDITVNNYIFWYADGNILYGNPIFIDEDETPEVNYLDYFVNPSR